MNDLALAARMLATALADRREAREAMRQAHQAMADHCHETDHEPCWKRTDQPEEMCGVCQEFYEAEYDRRRVRRSAISRVGHWERTLMVAADGEGR